MQFFCKKVLQTNKKYATMSAYLGKDLAVLRLRCVRSIFQGKLFMGYRGTNKIGGD